MKLTMPVCGLSLIGCPCIAIKDLISTQSVVACVSSHATQKDDKEKLELNISTWSKEPLGEAMEYEAFKQGY